MVWHDDVARSDFQAIKRIDGWLPCRHVIVSYLMIGDGEIGVLNYAGPGNYCPVVSSGAGICRNHCRSVESMAKRTGWRIKVEERLSSEYKCALLGSRAPWDSIFKVCDNRQLLRTDIRNVSAIVSWLLQFPTMFASRPNFTLCLMRDFPLFSYSMTGAQGRL